MKKKYVGALVRILLTVMLNVIVWLNAHWSVALSVLLIFIALELNSIFNDHVEQRLKTLENIMRL